MLILATPLSAHAGESPSELRKRLAGGQAKIAHICRGLAQGRGVEPRHRDRAFLAEELARHGGAFGRGHEVLDGRVDRAHPMLTALMSGRVPEDAQGALQGGISAITNLAMLAGTVFYAQIFGYFMSQSAPFQSPNVAYYVAGAGLALTLALYLALVGHQGGKA